MRRRKKSLFVSEIPAEGTAETDEGVDWEGQPEQSNQVIIERVEPQFEPRLRKAGELILANDWNNIQTELKSDINKLSNAVNLLVNHSSILTAAGITSHGIYVDLNWKTKPIVLVSLSGTVNESENNPNFRCYAHEITAKGFKIHAQSEVGKENGIVNWIAFANK